VKNESSATAKNRLVRAALAGTAAAVLLAAIWCGVAGAAMVSGVLTEYEGPPAKDRQVHFENRLSGDMFLVATGDDGAFAADLPPGTYDLRGERGLVIKGRIVVDREAVNLGTVRHPPPLDVRKPFQREGIAETIVESAAPATANVGPGAQRLKDEADAPGAAPTASASAPTAQASPMPVK
jgi:hypothetical protein